MFRYSLKCLSQTTTTITTLPPNPIKNCNRKCQNVSSTEAEAVISKEATVTTLSISQEGCFIFVVWTMLLFLWSHDYKATLLLS